MKKKKQLLTQDRDLVFNKSGRSQPRVGKVSGMQAPFILLLHHACLQISRSPSCPGWLLDLYLSHLNSSWQGRRKGQWLFPLKTYSGSYMSFPLISHCKGAEKCSVCSGWVDVHLKIRGLIIKDWEKGYWETTLVLATIFIFKKSISMVKTFNCPRQRQKTNKNELIFTEHLLCTRHCLMCFICNNIIITKNTRWGWALWLYYMCGKRGLERLEPKVYSSRGMQMCWSGSSCS